ncbi:hypothetical protein [Catenovulum sediminis]|uniref:hypothetical protein n=1 Tax=Catenovulum sediminis TaxID=1740262 RepID=UPI00163D5BD1|nr:hypothetical protein [Catenovulum sediminis]
MNYGNEMRSGYLFSFLSPMLVSGVVAIWAAIEEFSHNGFGAIFSTFIGSYLLFGIFSFLYMAVFCAIIGLPIYYVLRKLDWVNPVLIITIGGTAGFLYALIDTANLYFRGLFVAYGAAGALFFWLGSNRVRKKLIIG